MEVRILVSGALVHVNTVILAKLDALSRQQFWVIMPHTSSSVVSSCERTSSSDVFTKPSANALTTTGASGAAARMRG